MVVAAVVVVAVVGGVGSNRLTANSDTRAIVTPTSLLTFRLPHPRVDTDATGINSRGVNPSTLTEKLQKIDTKDHLESTYIFPPCPGLHWRLGI